MWELEEGTPRGIREYLFECTNCRTERKAEEEIGGRRMRITKDVDEKAKALGIHKAQKQDSGSEARTETSRNIRL